MGTNPLTEGSKIAKEVLEEMRRFLIVDTGENMSIKIDKVKKSLREALSDLMLQRTVLRLEYVPIMTAELNKGKGPVFDYGAKEIELCNWDLKFNPNKLMAASMKANKSMVALSTRCTSSTEANDDSEGIWYGTLSDCPTVFSQFCGTFFFRDSTKADPSKEKTPKSVETKKSAGTDPG